MKLLTIKDEDENEAYVETVRRRRLYEISDAINVSPDAQVLPPIFDDMDKNAELCGAPEIPMGDIIKASKDLEDLTNEFVETAKVFFEKVEILESRGSQILDPLLNQARAVRPDLVMAFEKLKFKDQNGRATIAAKISLPLEGVQSKPVAIEHNVEVLEG